MNFYRAEVNAFCGTNLQFIVGEKLDAIIVRILHFYFYRLYRFNLIMYTGRA